MVPRRQFDDNDDGENVNENREETKLDDLIERLVNQKCETHAEQMAKETRNAWSLTPQTVSTYIAILTIVLGAAWTFSDFRVTLNDLSSRQTILSDRLMQTDARITSIDNNGTRQLIGEEATIKTLKEQIEELKDAVDGVNGAIAQHNESMYDLYRKQNPGKALPRHHETGDIPLIPTPRRKTDVLPGNDGFATRGAP